MPGLTIYTDESVKNGKHYSNFYGGVILRDEHLAEIEARLDRTRYLQGLRGETKWGQITELYVDRYLVFMNEFFDLIEEGKLRVRVMFIANHNRPEGLRRYYEENQFTLLYYQFLKHGFGLRSMPVQDDWTWVRFRVDTMTRTKYQKRVFKDHLVRMFATPEMRDRLLFTKPHLIEEIHSHRHVIHQGLDVVLGGMQFVLNSGLALESPQSRTRGKSRVASHCLQRIGGLVPGFSPGQTTRLRGAASWEMSYSHWNFVPRK